MRLQRYPDGAMYWNLFIWSRHPKWSMTWTHSLTLTRYRRESGVRRFGLFHIPCHQSRYGVAFFGLQLELTTQAPMRREQQ